MNCENTFIPFRQCSKSCQLAILYNIPLADIARVLSDSYGIKIAEDEKLTIASFGPANEQHVFPATKITMGKFKISYYLIDDFLGVDNIDGACYSFENTTFNPFAIDVDYTYDKKRDKVVFRYDIAAVEVMQEQMGIIAPATYSDEQRTLISHQDDIEAIDISSFSGTMWDKMREYAVKIPFALERDIKAYQLSSKP